MTNAREAHRRVVERLRAQRFTVVLAAPGAPVDLIAGDGDAMLLIRVGETRDEALAATGELEQMTWPPASRVEVWWGAGNTWHHRVESST